MRRTRSALSRNSFNSSNIIFIVLCCLFLIGMCYGAITSKMTTNLSLSEYGYSTLNMSSRVSDMTLWERFSSSLFSNLLFLFLSYLFGYWAIGQPLILAIPFFKGLGLGYFMAYLYQTYNFQGIVYSLLIIIPYTVVALFALIISCRESIKLSNLYFSAIIPKSTSQVNLNVIKLYNIKFLVLVAMALISSVINVVTYFLFARMFDF